MCNTAFTFKIKTWLQHCYEIVVSSNDAVNAVYGIDVSKNYLQMTPHRTITDGNSLTVNIFMTCIWEPVTF